MMGTIHTIGHSTHSYEQFAAALTHNGIEVLVDVRSAPYSAYTPQFDRELLKQSLADSGIRYLFLGAELGGRPSNPDFYDTQGRVVYGRLVLDSEFIAGIERLERGLSEFRIAIMCGEENPTHCHRRLLVSRVMIERGHTVMHIRADGRTETDAQVAAATGKELVNAQPALFPDIEEDQWRSTVSVSPKKGPKSSSKR